MNVRQIDQICPVLKRLAQFLNLGFHANSIQSLDGGKRI
jgi:hypothetical protein